MVITLLQRDKESQQQAENLREHKAGAQIELGYMSPT